MKKTTRPLVLRPVSLLETNLFHGWYEKRHDLGAQKKLPLDVFSFNIGFPHNGADCELVSAEFRGVATGILESLISQDLKMVCWVYGPIDRGGLSSVYPHLAADYQRRYYISAIDKRRSAGYGSGWIAAEFHHDWFLPLMNDDAVQLSGPMEICGVLTTEQLVEELLLEKGFREETFFPLLQKVDLAFSSSSHFESFYFFSRKMDLKSFHARLKSSFSMEIPIVVEE